jgi:hypothetical protein
MFRPLPQAWLHIGDVPAYVADESLKVFFQTVLLFSYKKAVSVKDTACMQNYIIE